MNGRSFPGDLRKAVDGGRGWAAALVAMMLVSVIFGAATPVRAAPGDLDASFGGDGVVTTDFGAVVSNDPEPGDLAEDVVLQPDGKTVVGGVTYADDGFDERFALVRYNADGSLDTSFHGDGKASTDMGSPNQWLTALALQADNKVVAAGSAEGDFGNYLQEGFALARYNADGFLDTSFGGDGRVTTDIGSDSQAAYGDYAEDVVVQPDGKIVAVGTSTCCNDREFGSVFALVRYNANGSLDTSFGGDGKVTTDFGGPAADSGINSAIAQPDGKIVVAGVEEDDSRSRFALARYNADGSLDTSFGGGDGKVTTAGGTARAVALQPDGKVLAAGSGDGSFALLRYNANGVLDTGFGGGDGKVTTDFGCISSFCGGTNSRANDIAIEQGGKLVLGGVADRGGITAENFALARYTANGSLDASFGGDGRMVTDISRSDDPFCDSGNALALQSDESIVLAGTACPNDTTAEDFAVVRYQGGEAPDTAPPVVKNVSPTGKTTDRTPTIKATVTDGVTGLAKEDITLEFDGVEVPGEGFNYSTKNVLTYNPPRLSRGAHSVRITATDAAGNTGVKGWSFKVVRKR